MKLHTSAVIETIPCLNANAGIHECIDVFQAQVIKSCYGDRVSEIGHAGNISDSFVASISSGNPISLVLLNGSDRPVNSDVVPSWFRNKLQVFVVTATSSLEFQRILVDLKKSQWWNHMARFYVLDSSGKEDECSRAFDLLWTAWMMNILGAKFICNNVDQKVSIYTFNPYTEDAPGPWRLEKTFEGVNTHPWALLVRNCCQNVNVCENLDFDQTGNCGGYEIGVTLSAIHKIVNASSINRFSENPMAEKNMVLMWRHMNATIKISYCSPNESLGSIDKEGKARGMLADLIDGRSDMVYRVSLWSAIAGVSRSYPSFNVYYFAVTQYTHYPTQLEKVISAIDTYSRIGLCVVIIVNVIFFKYAMRQSLMTAILNTLRMICNSCFTKLPNDLGPRIYLVCLFCFVVIIQALYQGQLAALLAQHVRYPNVNNGRDLINSDYVIYGRHNDSVIFSDPGFKGRFFGINNFAEKCTNRVLRNSTIACVGGREMLMKDALDSKLHMSKNPVVEVPMSLPIRKDWPLEDRFNRHTLYYIESGLREHHYKTVFASAHRNLDLEENGSDGEGFKVLFLQDLDFAFAILAIGLGCATISFFVELYIP